MTWVISNLVSIVLGVGIGWFLHVFLDQEREVVKALEHPPETPPKEAQERLNRHEYFVRMIPGYLALLVTIIACLITIRASGHADDAADQAKDTGDCNSSTIANFLAASRTRAHITDRQTVVTQNRITFDDRKWTQLKLFLDRTQNPEATRHSQLVAFKIFFHHLKQDQLRTQNLQKRAEYLANRKAEVPLPSIEEARACKAAK